MKRYQIRAMLASTVFAALSLLAFKSQAARLQHAPGHRRANVVGTAGAVEAAHERPRVGAHPVHDRQAGAHRVRLSEHHIGRRLAAASTYVPAGVDSVLAAEAQWGGTPRRGQCGFTAAPTPPRSTATTSSSPLGNQPGATAANAAAAGTRGRPAQPAAAVERSIRTIDFRRGSDGTGPRHRAAHRSAHRRSNVRQEGNQVVVDFAGTLMPKNLMRRYDVMDLRPPRCRRSMRSGWKGSSRLVISAQGRFSNSSPINPTINTPSKSSLPSSAPNAEEKKEYTGERLTLKLPGHRCPFGAATPCRHQRPEYRGQRFGPPAT